jgi:putative ABC transport system permease protein
MKILLKISWRNVWRNPKRSLVMIIAIAVGLWGGIFAASLSFGLIEQRFKTTVEQQVSHIQMHHPEFLKDNNVKYGIADWNELKQALNADEDISAFSGRTKVNGMLASANLTSGVNIIGVDPAQEAATTRLNNNIVEGHFFDEAGRNPVLVGKELAEKTKIQERSRIVLTFQDIEGELVSATFRVAGIYQTANSSFDERNVYVLQSDLTEYIGGELKINEVALIGHDLEQIPASSERYQNEFPGLTIRTWSEISPELSYMQETTGTMLMIVLVIILLALAFGLVNTMLMSVFERIKELGVLMAVGMNKRRIFGMIMLETIFLTFIGAAGGMLSGIFTIRLLGRTGLDLAAVGGDSLNEFGFPTVVYPNLETSFFLMLIVLVVITAVVTAIYPSLKALKLRPAEAVNQD